jgi:hypothetical protein
MRPIGCRKEAQKRRITSSCGFCAFCGKEGFGGVIRVYLR